MEEQNLLHILKFLWPSLLLVVLKTELHLYISPEKSNENSYCYHYTDTIAFNFKMHKYIQ